MAFDLENAVQQGFNRDVTNNDWHVEARNLEIKLDDHGGVREFRILDNENVGVVVADSDGYLSIAGNAEVHGGHVLVRGEGLTNTEYMTLQDQTDEMSLFMFDADPNGTVTGTLGSFGTNYNDGYIYVNVDGSQKWERLALQPEVIPVVVTLHQAYKNDPDGGNATITTDVLDGNVIITGTERFEVTTSKGVNIDTVGLIDIEASSGGSGRIEIDGYATSHFIVDSGDLTLATTTEGDVWIKVPDGTGDFYVDDAGGARYIRAITSNGELQLGDATTPVFVTVMNDMEVMGDFTVQGTTTTINTQEMFVEDRLVRLNTGSPSNFSGNVGIEAEVGSDGYVEFHWDDTQGRWEISIDRNTTPEAETFRPLAYLADSPSTLDLSSIGVSSVHNATAGAAVINTNSDNFYQTFGPDMVNNSVQAALEAIDGYFKDMAGDLSDIDDVTLQIAYNNDADGGDATITTNSNDGDVIIAGTEMFQVTAAEGVSVNTTGVIDLEADGVIEIDGYADSHFIVKDGDLWLATDRVNGTTGDVNIDSAEELNVTTGTDIFVQAGVDGVSGKITIQATDDSLFYVDTADLTLMTGTTGDVKIDSGDSVIVDADVNIDMEATAAVEIDGYADSHFIADGGQLRLATTTTGSVIIDGIDGITLNGNGDNILPEVTCQDSLGDASHGFTGLWLCNGAGIEVPIGGPGGSSVSNTTSGAYVVGTNSDNFTTFGPDMTTNTVQAALEAIDGYFKDLNIEDLVDSTFTQTATLDINGAVLNGVVRVSTDAGTPALDFHKVQTSRASWSIPVPADWDGISDFDVDVVWSPQDTSGGNVEWRLEWKSLALTELASSAASTDDYTQAAGGTADAIQSTGTNLSIPAGGNVDPTDEIIVINLVRRGSAAGDTYGKYAQVHLVKYSYTAENIV